MKKLGSKLIIFKWQGANFWTKIKRPQPLLLDNNNNCVEKYSSIKCKSE